MKKLFVLSAITLLLGFNSCVKSDYYAPATPRLQQVSFIDDFNNNKNNWQFADGQNLAYGVISNGTFKVDYNNNYLEAYYVSKAININTYNDFTISSRIGSNKNMGLLFGYNANTNSYGYSFTVDYNGYFALYDEGGNGYGASLSTLVPKTKKPFVNVNGNWNEVSIEQRGNRWIGYINNNQVFDVPAQNMKGGSVGFVVMSETQGEADYLEASWFE